MDNSQESESLLRMEPLRKPSDYTFWASRTKLILYADENAIVGMHEAPFSNSAIWKGEKSNSNLVSSAILRSSFHGFKPDQHLVWLRRQRCLRWAWSQFKPIKYANEVLKYTIPNSDLNLKSLQWSSVS